jgi:hypothetical protein
MRAPTLVEEVAEAKREGDAYRAKSLAAQPPKWSPRMAAELTPTPTRRSRRANAEGASDDDAP